jgi:hypothetical protein
MPPSHNRRTRSREVSLRDITNANDLAPVYGSTIAKPVSIASLNTAFNSPSASTSSAALKS